MRRPQPPQSPLVVRLREIPADEGLSLDLDLLSGDFAKDALQGTEAAAHTSALRAEVTLMKSGEQVIARGRLSGAASLTCSRCAGEAPAVINTPFQVIFVPAGSEDSTGDDRADDERELTEDDLDVTTYVDDEIDLRAPLREELLLTLPYAPLCREDCKGLCASCGTDLNEGKCNCAPPPADDPKGRWSALKNVKL